MENKAKALLARAYGAYARVYPKNGKDFSLEELQGFVGGYIEIVRLGQDMIMVVNEEGKLMGLPINTYATELAFPGHQDVIVGDVIICNSELVK